MAPDRGGSRLRSPSPAPSNESRESHELSTHVARRVISNRSAKHNSDMGLYMTRSNASRSGGGGGAGSDDDVTHFSIRSVAAGLAIGTVVCFSSTYFGLQTGWISGMAMPSSLIGFALFRSLSRYLTVQFTPAENVLVQTIAAAVGTMPLGLGFVGVIPSIQFLLKESEGAPVDLSFWKLFVWGVGLCLFGCVFAVPLRKQVIIREKLRFPTGTATALLISVLHGTTGSDQDRDKGIETQGTEEREQLLRQNDEDEVDEQDDRRDENAMADWRKQVRLLSTAFAGSALYTLVQYFIPILHSLPVFGNYLAKTWLWTLNPSPAYVGQGIIMGPATTLHMLFGAILGYAILSPLAKTHGWAPGPADSWENGSKGWIVWVSLAIMLADAIINLGWLVLRPLIRYGPDFFKATKHRFDYTISWRDFLFPQDRSKYFTIDGVDDKRDDDDPPDDAPPEHLITGRAVAIWLPATMVLCIVCVHLTFGEYIPISLNVLALFLALLLSVMGVRATGETDLNPVSGIAKLTQLIFAAITPNSKNAIVINLIAGAVSESGALQAGDMMQDLKTGHLIGASPKAQFWGQIIGSLFGAVVSPLLYKLYTSVYEIPNDLFQIPTAYVWIFTARLVTGQGLPPMAWQYAVVVGAVFVITTVLRIWLLASDEGSWKRKVYPWIPGGIAVAVGMYNTPSFTLARTVGGLITFWHVNHKGRSQITIVVLASGLILGEGVVSIINLVLASSNVPHLK